jgi:DUF1680 family protein
MLEASFPMTIEKLEANPQVLPTHGKLALRRGPLVYALEQADNESDLDLLVLPRDASLTSEFRPDLLGGIHVLQGQGLRRDLESWEGFLYRQAAATAEQPSSIRAVPYAVWGNRGLGKMKVWVDSGR